MNVTAELQLLRKRWQLESGLCVICGAMPALEDDHIPPRALFPKSLRDPTTEFLTYPVCMACNRGSSDSDFVLAFRLGAELNQTSYARGVDPIDPDLLELHRQNTKMLTSEKEGKRRIDILAPRLRGHAGVNATGAIDLPDSMVLPTIQKMMRALYWLKTDGDIMERHKPSFWVRSGLDTTTEFFAKSIISKTNASIEWDNRFVTRYNIGGPQSAINGIMMSAFIFYSQGKAGRGYTWFGMAIPSNYEVDGELLCRTLENKYGPPTWKYRSIKRGLRKAKVK